MSQTRTLDELLSYDCAGNVQRAEALAVMPSLQCYLHNVAPVSAEPEPSIEVLLTGSVLFNGEGNDMDVLVHVTDIFGFADALRSSGWSRCALGEYPEDNFMPMRKGAINVLLVSDPALFSRWCTAGALCCALARVTGSIDKPTRVEVHRIVINEDSTGPELLTEANMLGYA